MSQAYREAGVDIEAGERAVAQMSQAVRSTFTPEVLSEVGAFGGLFAATRLQTMKEPVLVASTDGVGTKVEVAHAMGIYDTVGQDLVNHCVNDILVQGAEPLFFLDFIGCQVLHPEQVAAVVAGIALACRQVGCALLGGETAEMRDVYREGRMEVAGTIIGVVERSEVIDGSTIKAGDRLLALPSSGLHTNGYTLARKTFANDDWKAVDPQLGRPLGEAMLDVHRCYLGQIRTLRQDGIVLKGLAHITGGGIPGNLSRILPAELGARVSLAQLRPPAIFARSGLAFEDMLPAFNLGVGMIVVVAAEQEAAARQACAELVPLGEITSGKGITVA